MRRLLLLLPLLLLLGCPKQKTSTTWEDPALQVTGWAIFVADAEGVTPPERMKVEARSRDGAFVLAEAPALWIDEPPAGWRKWTRIGDATARARLSNPQWILDAAAQGKEVVDAVLLVNPDPPPQPTSDGRERIEDPRDIRQVLLDAGLELGAVEGTSVPVRVPRGSWGAMLKLPHVLTARAP